MRRVTFIGIPLDGRNDSKTAYIYFNGSLVARNEVGGAGSNLPAPGNLRTSPNPSSTGNYTLSWNPVTGASRYRLFELVSGSWTEIQHASTTTFPVTNKPVGTWFYRVRACVDTTLASCGPDSLTATATVTGGGVTPPIVPTGLAISPNPSTTDSFTVSWQSAAGATSYVLEEQFAGGAWQSLPSQPGLTWSPNPPKSQNGTWSYRVQACNSGGCSALSASKSVVVAVIGVPGGISVMPAIVFVTRPNANYTVSWGASAAAST